MVRIVEGKTTFARIDPVPGAPTLATLGGPMVRLVGSGTLGRKKKWLCCRSIPTSHPSAASQERRRTENLTALGARCPVFGSEGWGQQSAHASLLRSLRTGSGRHSREVQATYVAIGLIVVLCYSWQRFDEPSFPNEETLPHAVEPIQYLFTGRTSPCSARSTAKSKRACGLANAPARTFAGAAVARRRTSCSRPVGLTPQKRCIAT
jgi:hypothetical protein